MKPIYLDHNSTTPLLPEVAEAMAPWQSNLFGNPASQHAFGRRARTVLEDAREAIAHMLGADLAGRRADTLIFTSGGTEANNLAIMGLARPAEDMHGACAIVSAVEHPSVIAPAEHLARHGLKVHRLAVDRTGVVSMAALDEVLDERPRFCAVMLANNETGVLQPIADVASRCAAAGVPLHVDAAQAVGKLPVDFRALAASTMTVAAHKFHGPLGIGALVIRHDVTLEPLLHGGVQQQSLRPGTESVALAVGMQAALEAWHRQGQARTTRLREFRDRLEAGLTSALGAMVVVNGASAPRAPHTSNVAFLGLDRQALVMALDLEGVYCSTGSACASGSSEPSPALLAMGAEEPVLRGSLRFSLGATTTTDEIDEAAARIIAVVRRMASLGAGHTTATRDRDERIAPV